MPTRLESGLKINSGNTKAMNDDVYDTFLNMVYQIVPWETNAIKYPSIMWRCIILLMIIFMRCAVDGLLTEKWNEYYHWTCVIPEEKKTCDSNTDPDFMKYYNLQIGDIYWKCHYPLMIVLCGDGTDFPQTNVTNGSIGLIKMHIYTNKHLQQTLLIALLFMIAGVSHYNENVIEIYQNSSYKLGIKGGISFLSTKAKCKLVCDWFRYDNGDWPWVATIVQRCQHHSGNYPFIYWIKHIGKKFVAVKNSAEKLFKAIKSGIKDEHMPWNFDIDKIKPHDNFYCLPTEYHFKSWVQQIEDYMSQLKNIDKLTTEQKHQKRRKYANKNGIPLLYATRLILVQYILDLLHAILRCVCFWIVVLGVVLYCPYRRSIDEVCAVLSHLCM